MPKEVGCCNHCYSVAELKKVGKWSLCENCEGLKQYQQKEKKVNKIKQVSTKQQSKLKEYSKVRKVEIKNICEARLNCCTGQATDIHHKMGKVGYADDYAREKGITLLVDARFFLSVCRSCHSFIEVNPEFAYKNKFSLKRN